MQHRLRYVHWNNLWNIKTTQGCTNALKDVLRKDSDIVAAGYCLYGSSTVLVLTTGIEVDG